MSKVAQNIFYFLISEIFESISEREVATHYHGPV